MFTYIDLFCGIGGFHLACSYFDSKCLGACDIDPQARQIYFDNYGIKPHVDIKTFVSPSVDLLCAGFPCQAHSTLGERKGSKDRRGKRLFIMLTKVIMETKPKVILLENVKGLLSSDNGTYFEYILKTLKGLGYKVSWNLLNSKNFGVPQNRERVFIVCSLNTIFSFDNIETVKTMPVSSIFEHKASLVPSVRFANATITRPKRYESGFVLRAKLSNYTHMKLYSSHGIVGTLATTCPPDVYDEKHKLARQLTNKELLRLQGFPDDFKFPEGCSRSTYVHYLGNSVTVPVIVSIIKEIIAQDLLHDR